MRLPTLLPPDPAELDQWLSEAITAEDPMLFTYLSVAVGTAARPFHALHLERGLHLWPNPFLTGWFVWNAAGDVAAAVAQALAGPTFPAEHKAVALLLVTAWCREHPDHPITGHPDSGSASARPPRGPPRRRARHSLCPRRTHRRPAPPNDSRRRGLRQSPPTARSLHRRNPPNDVARLFSNLSPSHPPRELARGATMRRSVERIGRNEDCPCGSGKKYKRCCYERDQDRLHRSTSVAGKTYADLRAEPEAHLTLATSPARSASPTSPGSTRVKVPADFARPVLRCGLAVAGLFEHLAEAYEKLPWEGEDRDSQLVGRHALGWPKSWRRDIAERLLQSSPRAPDDCAGEIPRLRTLPR